MDANAIISGLDWLAKVLVSAGIVFGLVWRIINAMISKKVDAQIAALSEKVTRANTESMEKLRVEISDNHRDLVDAQNDRFDALTNRIDHLFRNGR